MKNNFWHPPKGKVNSEESKLLHFFCFPIGKQCTTTPHTCIKKVDFNICLAFKYSVNTDPNFFTQASCLKLQNAIFLNIFHYSTNPLISFHNSWSLCCGTKSVFLSQILQTVWYMIQKMLESQALVSVSFTFDYGLIR